MDDEAAAGRLTIRGFHGSVMVLDLSYEGDLVGEGFFLAPQAESLELLCSAKLTITRNLLDRVRERFTDEYPWLDFSLSDMESPSLEFSIRHEDNSELVIHIYRSNPERDVWTGRIEDSANGEEVIFLLEGYGSQGANIHPIDLALFKWTISCDGDNNDKRFWEFFDECRETCKEENKECGVRKRMDVEGCRLHCVAVASGFSLGV